MAGHRVRLASVVAVTILGLTPWPGEAATGSPSSHENVAAVGTGFGGSRSFMDIQGVAGLATLSDGKLTRRTYVLGYRAPSSLARMRLVFVNEHFANFREAPGPNVIFVRATVEFPVGTAKRRPTFYRVTTNRSTEWQVAPGSRVITDATSGVRVPAGREYRVRVFVRVAHRGERWPLARPAMVGDAGAPFAPTRREGVYNGDLLTTNRGWVPASSSPYAPQAILAPTSAPGVAIVGDSIAHGYDSTEVGGGYYGGIVRALEGRSGYVSLATDSETAENFAKPSLRRLRMGSLTGVKYAVVLIGRNDLSTNKRSVAQVQGDLLAIWRGFAERGIKVYACTILPRTSSTDEWKTRRNQTVDASESKRIALNDWIRSGAPIDRKTLRPMAVPAPGAVKAGAARHPLAGYFETADTVETARNSGIWKVDGSPDRYTAGGVHPTAAGYRLMAGAIKPAVFTTPASASPASGGSGFAVALLVAVVALGGAVIIRQIVKTIRV